MSPFGFMITNMKNLRSDLGVDREELNAHNNALANTRAAHLSRCVAKAKQEPANNVAH